MSSSATLSEMSPKDEEVKPKETKDKSAPKMMKGGLRDRPFLSWMRIMLVTASWWAFVIGFTSLCFFLMYKVIYGSNDTEPYFARNFLKYPSILHQPGLNIKCRKLLDTVTGEYVNSSYNTTLLSIGINRVYNWEPKTYTNQDYPRVEGEVYMKDDLEAMGWWDVPANLVYVTCNGREQADKDNLKGMKITRSPGFEAYLFPWLGTDNEERQKWLERVTVDLAGSKVAKSYSDNTSVFLECRAWARNIKLEKRFVDKKIPNGGGLAILCFKDGKIAKIVKNVKDCK